MVPGTSTTCNGRSDRTEASPRRVGRRGLADDPPVTGCGPDAAPQAARRGGRHGQSPHAATYFVADLVDFHRHREEGLPPRRPWICGINTRWCQPPAHCEQHSPVQGALEYSFPGWETLPRHRLVRESPCGSDQWRVCLSPVSRRSRVCDSQLLAAAAQQRGATAFRGGARGITHASGRG